MAEAKKTDVKDEKKEEKAKQEETPFITLEVRDATDSVVAGYKVRYDPDAVNQDRVWSLSSSTGTAMNSVDPSTPVVILRIPAFVEAMKDFDVQKQKDERDEALVAAQNASVEGPKEEDKETAKTNG